MPRWAGGNYGAPFTRFPQASNNRLRDVVSPAIVPCETCQAKRGQACAGLKRGQEFHHIRWVDALTAGR